jgi:hypothetical protein
MRILFQTKKVSLPSTIFNYSLIKELAYHANTMIDFYNNNYKNYDVVLFMGYDPDVENARRDNPSIKIGVIDPRPDFNINFSDIDFILANGIEMKDYFSRFCKNILIYPIYPKLEFPAIRRKNKKLVIGYHGNKVHLQASAARIMPAIELLSQIFEVEAWLMYDVNSLGKWNYKPSNNKLTIKHIQWSDEGYCNHMSQVDIGIVPSLIPIRNEFFVKKIFKNIFNKFNESDSDYLLRFKVTSNVGRALVFAQLKVPIVMDMTPSALQLVTDSVDGFICHSTESWFNSLLKLAENDHLRVSISEKMYKKFNLEYSSKEMNIRLLNFLSKIV